MTRGSLIAASAVGTAVASAAVALTVPAIFEGHRDPLRLLWDPLFLVPAAQVVGLALLIALPLALVLLRPTQLQRTIPIVAGATVTATAAGSLVGVCVGPPVGLAVGVVTMLGAWMEPDWREPLPERRRLGAPL